MIRSTQIWLTVLLLISFTVSPINARTAGRYRLLSTELNPATANRPDDDPTPTPTPTPDPEVEKANKEKTLAEAKKASEDAKKAASDAEAAAIAAKLAAARAKLGLPATDSGPSATAPSGNTTAGEATTQFIETQILADTGGRMASLALVEHLCGGKPEVPALKATPMKTLIVNNTNDKAAVSQYRTTVAQLQLLHEHYLKLMKQSADERDDTKATAALAPLLIPAATQIVKNVADLINLFRTETQISSQNVTVDSRFIVSNLANELLGLTNSQQCQVKAIYHPAIYPLTVPKGAKSALFDAYKQLLDDVIAGDREVSENAKKVAALNKEKADDEGIITKLQEQIADAKKKAEEKKKPAKGPKKSKKKPEPEASPFIAQAEKQIGQARTFIDTKLVPRIQRLQQAADTLTAFKTSLTKLFEILTAVDDATKQPIFNNLVSAERMSDLLADPGTYVLTLNIKALGTNRTRKNLFFNAKVDHSGGASVDANLFNSEDQLVFGKVENFYIEFTGSKKIRERSGFKRLDQLGR